MAPKAFKAIIVGGGVGGLVLANALEQLGIDYVLLEKYGEFTPQIGASIAMSGTGQRIMDQLGCKQPFLEGVPSLDTTMPTVEGKSIFLYLGYNVTQIKRLGHGIVFNDRQMLLRTFYDNIRDKSKLLVNKSVASITTTATSATVKTKDGEIFEGDIVVGFDGIHSTVREEMWRIAAKEAPGYFPKDEWTRVPIDTRCLFGIGRAHKKIPPGTVITVIGRGFSNLIISGPEGKVYFFLFERLPKRLYGHQTPRYTTDDAKALAEAHRNDLLVDGCTFGQIFENRISSGMTAIHEHVFEKWHYGRIITLGDAAHKPDPISGHGGNSAIESAAELVNQLKRRLDKSPNLSAQDIDSAFRDTQATRFERVKKVVSVSHKAQDFNTGTGLMGKIGVWLAPWIMSEDGFSEMTLGLAVDSARIDALPVPFYPHYIPWTDELPAKPMTQSWIPRAVVGVVLLALVYVAGYGMPTAVTSLPETTFLGHPFRGVYTGYQAIDAILLMLTKVFANLLGSPNPEHRLQMVYFLPMLVPLALIWTVEGHRRGNLQTIPGAFLKWPTMYAFLYQAATIARAGPIYFFISMLVGSQEIYHRTTSRIVDQDVARAVLPATCVAFGLPTIFMLLPLWDGPALWLDFITFWQLAPLLVGPATTFLASLIRARRLISEGKTVEVSPQVAAAREAGITVVGDLGNDDLYKNKDVPHLLSAYAAMFWVGAGLHIATLVYFFATPSVSLRTTFLDLPCWPWLAGAATAEWSKGADVRTLLSVTLRWDLVVFTASLLVWCLHTVVEMRRVGYVRTVDACKAAAAVVGSLVLAGPGAMYAATWYWREKTIAGQSKMEEGEQKKVR